MSEPPPQLVDPGIAIRRRFAPHRRRLAVGALLPAGAAVARWAHDVLAWLDAEPAVDLSLLREGGAARDGRRRAAGGAPAARLIEWLRARGSGGVDPFAPGALAGHFAARATELPGGGAPGTLSPATADAVRARRLDVLVWLGEDPLSGDCAGLARLGEWAFRFGDPGRALVRPFYWREIAAGEPVSVIALQRYTVDFPRGETIAEDAVATKPGWRFVENAVEPAALAGPLLVRALLDAAADEERFVARAGPAAPARAAAPRAPSLLDAARFLAGRARHSVAARVVGHAESARQDWFVAMRRRAPEAAAAPPRREEMRAVPMPAGVQYADPFLWEADGRRWLFMEKIPAYGEKAHLVCLEVRDDLAFGEPGIVLEKPYHLSYPCVLRHEGTHYMIPESGDDGTVQLYRATRFPFEWRREAVLCEGLPLRDTTPFLHEAVWYFFTTLHERGAETFLFHADRLDGPWRYHPANPICADTRRARGAGALFRRGASLIRPSQDCAVRYGYAVVLNEVTRLTPTEYAERPIETILPDWWPNLMGTHTINRDGAFEVLDGSLAMGRRR